MIKLVLVSKYIWMYINKKCVLEKMVVKLLPAVLLETSKIVVEV